MNAQDGQGHAHKQSTGKNESYETYRQVGGAFKSVFFKFHKLPFPQIVLSLLINFIPSIFGAIMGSTKGLIIGVTTTLTVCIWSFAYLLMKEANPPDKPENTVSPTTMNNSGNVTQQGNGNVNAPNNSGNINTGAVAGNLEQTVVVGPKPRVLSDAQIKRISNGLSGKSSGCNVYFCIDGRTQEGLEYAKGIAISLKNAGYNVSGTVDSGNAMAPTDGISVSSNPDDLPDVDHVVSAMIAAGLPARKAGVFVLTQGEQVPRKLPALFIFIARNAAQ